MKEKMLTFRVGRLMKKTIHQNLREIKKKTRYTYPEIVVRALEAYRRTIQ